MNCLQSLVLLIKLSGNLAVNKIDIVAKIRLEFCYAKSKLSGNLVVINLTL